VQEVAISAATRDPRFPPLTLAELDTIHIEIAILSPMRIINDLQQINIGQDGL
jgi:AMMECR1 domain-containing protein